MSTHRIHVFISHSWAYSGHYDRLREWIFERTWRFGQASLAFLDYSVPKDDPIHDARSDRALKDAIYRKIARSHVVVIPTGMYANYSKWIRKKMERGTRGSRCSESTPEGSEGRPRSWVAPPPGPSDGTAGVSSVESGSCTAGERQRRAEGFRRSAEVARHTDPAPGH